MGEMIKSTKTETNKTELCVIKSLIASNHTPFLIYSKTLVATFADKWYHLLLRSTTYLHFDQLLFGDGS